MPEMPPPTTSRRLVVAGVGIACRQLHFLHFGAAHAHVVVRHLLRGFARARRYRAGPDHAFAQVGARQRHAREIERLGLGAARTGGDHHVGDAFVVDVVADHLHAVGVAQEVVLAHQVHLAFLLRNLGQLRGIERARRCRSPGRCRLLFSCLPLC